MPSRPGLKDKALSQKHWALVEHASQGASLPFKQPSTAGV